MRYDKTKHGGSDRARIHLDWVYERRDWAKALGISEDELRRAVHAVGDNAEKVREYLRKPPVRAR